MPITGKRARQRLLNILIVGQLFHDARCEIIEPPIAAEHPVADHIDRMRKEYPFPRVPRPCLWLQPHAFHHRTMTCTEGARGNRAVRPGLSARRPIPVRLDYSQRLTPHDLTGV